MSGRPRRGQTVVLTSVVLGIISVIVMGLLKHRFRKIPFFNRILQLKDVGLDSMKDFLEVWELNLRADKDSSKMDTDVDGVRLLWDDDGSREYVVFVSSEYIPKTKLLYSDTIDYLEMREITELESSSNWTRKFHVKSDLPPRDIYEGDPVVMRCIVPLCRFHCRIRSQNGRVSRHLSYPNATVHKLEDTGVKAWVSAEGKNYYFHLQEPKSEIAGKIYDYQIVFYIDEGKGTTRTVPPFKGQIKMKLGELPSCLCYITGMRSMGEPFEQFVTWIGENESLTLGGLITDREREYVFE